MMEMTRTLSLPKWMDLTTLLDRPEWLAIIVLTIGVCGLVVAVNARMHRRALRTIAAQLGLAMNGVFSRIDAMEDDVKQIDRGLRHLLQRMDQLQLGQSSRGQFHQAVELVHDGASSAQLIEQCGLTRGEAELFQRLYS